MKPRGPGSGIGGRAARARRAGGPGDLQLGQRRDGYLPEPRGGLGIEGVRRDAPPGARLVRPRLVAVLEVPPADALEQRRRRDQHGCGGALLGRLPPGAPPPRLGAHPVELGVGAVTLQVVPDPPRPPPLPPHAPPAPPPAPPTPP